MKISVEMKKALNKQSSLESFASNYYLSMASWCDVSGYEGAAGYFYAQAEEERQHMLKIVKYLNSIGVAATIPAADSPPSKFKSLEGICKTALANEQSVTKAINSMVALAQSQNDHATFAFLQWYVTEQVQEETKFEAILQKFDTIGTDKLALVEIDRQLGAMAAASAAI